MAALPQCIQSAKQLYDLRSRYKDASVLICAIYSESMVIAASLSQVQNLLQHDTLRNKPQLLETFDRALTGCRVVYGCLEEEVRDLVAKAEADDLKFKDRAKFLWKEDTFKELLTQIRGQQSALSLLIQGLQMESIADIKKLVDENSVKLDQVVKRSKTLRQSHPRLKVPESLFDLNHADVTVDTETITKSTEFAFDDEVINSKVYRRAMALYMSSNETNPAAYITPDYEQDQPPAYEGSHKDVRDEKMSAVAEGPPPKRASTPSEEPGNIEVITPAPIELAASNKHQDAFDAVEKDYLPYMPRNTSDAPYSSLFGRKDIKQTTTETASTSYRRPIRSQSEGNLLSAEVEALSPPPRRPSGSQFLSSASSFATSSVQSTLSDDTGSPLALSNSSVASSYSTYNSSVHKFAVSRKPIRKPLPLTHQVSSDILRTARTTSIPSKISTSASPLQSLEMHAIWLSLVDAEQKFVERMTKLRKMFYDNVVRQWPLLEEHLGAIPLGEDLAIMNKDALLQAMEQQVSKSDGAICDSSLFEQWTHNAHKSYQEYCQKMPHAAASLRKLQSLDPKFGPFVNTVGLSLVWFGMGWEDYLKLPVTQLELYSGKLQSLLKLANASNDSIAVQESARLERAVVAVQWMRTLASTALEDAEGKEEILDLEKRIYTPDSHIFSQLRLLDSNRRVRFQGSMALKLKSQGSWQAVHVMLLDNYLIWGKVKPEKKSKEDRIVLLDSPIAVSDLDVATPNENAQSQKATMFDEIQRGSVLYIITVRNRRSETAPHMLGAFGTQQRKEWLENLTATDTVHDAST
jgi:hypothetical protein